LLLDGLGFHQTEKFLSNCRDREIDVIFLCHRAVTKISRSTSSSSRSSSKASLRQGSTGSPSRNRIRLSASRGRSSPRALRTTTSKHGRGFDPGGAEQGLLPERSPCERPKVGRASAARRRDPSSMAPTRNLHADPSAGRT
jgi:hypothetical protein